MQARGSRLEARLLREAQELSNPGTASLLATYLTNTASMLDRIRRGDTEWTYSKVSTFSKLRN